MRKYFILPAVAAILFTYGCASTEAINSRISTLEDRVGKLEQAPKAAPNTSALDAEVKKANDAALRAEAAATKAEAAATAASGAETKAETAAKKAAKEFELMQKK